VKGNRAFALLIGGQIDMTQSNNDRAREERKWVRIPNGTKVRIGSGGRDGTIDGLTELVTGSRRNPDGRTQYRISMVGEQERTLAAEDDLVILTDAEGLVLIAKQAIEYRSHVSRQLHAVLAADRFIKV
jgi:hypothetical protein